MAPSAGNLRGRDGARVMAWQAGIRCGRLADDPRDVTLGVSVRVIARRGVRGLETARSRLVRPRHKRAHNLVWRRIGFGSSWAGYRREDIQLVGSASQ